MRDEGAYPVGPAVDENSYAHSRAFGRNFGAAFGATLYRDFVRVRSTMCKYGKSIYMLDI
jgi:hypothetical protein